MEAAKFDIAEFDLSDLIEVLLSDFGCYAYKVLIV